MWVFIREPDDKLAKVRISLGTPNNEDAYLVFRGKPSEVVELLEKALQKARKELYSGNYQDRRGRPQG